MIAYSKHPNAQKWTAELVMDKLLAVEKEATEGKSLFLGKALSSLGLYRHVWTYWKRIFEQDDDIIEKMLCIESIFESKLLDGALRKELSGWVAMMALKNNYNWSDKGKKNDTLFHTGGQ